MIHGLRKSKTYNTQKKFGFITPQEGGKDLFFHISEIVTYDIGKDRQERAVAVNINNSHTKRSNSSPKRKSSSGKFKRELFTVIILIACFLKESYAACTKKY